VAYRIFYPIAPPPQGIVLKVEQLEARMDFFNEFANLERAGEVAEGYGVGCEAGLCR
jgi:hypothetical protein